MTNARCRRKFWENFSKEMYPRKEEEEGQEKNLYVWRSSFNLTKNCNDIHFVSPSSVFLSPPKYQRRRTKCDQIWFLCSFEREARKALKSILVSMRTKQDSLFYKKLPSSLYFLILTAKKESCKKNLVVSFHSRWHFFVALQVLYVFKLKRRSLKLKWKRERI